MKSWNALMGLIALVAPILLPGSLSAQRKIIVVDPGGQGDFKTIIDAVRSAKDGDVIRVRKGNYYPFWANRPLTILCDDGVQIDDPFRVAWISVTIGGVPKGKQFVLRGGTIGTRVFIKNCEGRVLIESTKIVLSEMLLDSYPALWAINCKDVTFHQIYARGRPSILCEGTKLRVLDSNILGSGVPYNSSYLDPRKVGIGLTAKKSLVEMAGGMVKGGPGNRRGFGFVPPQVAVDLWESIFVARGDASTSISAGDKGAASAMRMYKSPIRLDPRCVVNGSIGAPPHYAGIVIYKKIPTLWMTGAPVGGVMKGKVFSPQGDFVWVFYGSLGSPVNLPFLGGEFGLSFQKPLLLAGIGIQGPNEHLVFSFKIPKMPSDLGLAFGWQGLSFNPKTKVSLLTNEVSSVFR